MFKAGDAVEVEDYQGNRLPGEIVAGPHGSVWSGVKWYEVNVDGKVLQYFEENIYYPLSIIKGLQKSKNWISYSPILETAKRLAAGSQNTITGIMAAETKKPSENYTDWYAEQEAEKKKKAEEEGRCEQCGIKMEFDPRSWHLHCPIHGTKFNSHGF